MHQAQRNNAKNSTWQSNQKDQPRSVKTAQTHVLEIRPLHPRERVEEREKGSKGIGFQITAWWWGYLHRLPVWVVDGRNQKQGADGQGEGVEEGEDELVQQDWSSADPGGAQGVGEVA